MPKKITARTNMTYVALLRGINVGGNNRVEMKKLRELFASLGLQNVATYVNSGNVIFSSEKTYAWLAREIPRALGRCFSFEIKTLLRTEKNIRTVCAAIPARWQNDADQKTDVLFLWDEYDRRATLKLIKQNSTVDQLVYVPGAIIWHLDRRYYNQSGMHDFIGTTVYKHMTARNVNTTRKLAELMKRKI